MTMSARTTRGASAGCALLLLAYAGAQLAARSGASPELPASVHWGALVVAAVSAALLLRFRRDSADARGSRFPGYLDTVRRLALVIDAGDPFTRGRSWRIARDCRRMGEMMELSPRELEDLEYAALLHDLGRIAIQFDVFAKRSTLDEDERARVRNHPEASYELMRDIAPLRGAAELVLAHHEQPDGGGYPRGLTAERIPRGSAIIMVVAAFDAMTSDRPYRRGLPAPQAYAELRTCAGKMFFPEVVETFIALHESGALRASPSDDGLWALGADDPAQPSAGQDVDPLDRRRNQPARSLVGQP